MSADVIYLTWIICVLIDSKMAKQIVYFCSIYIFITLASVIGYFSLGANFPIELGLTQDKTAQWLRADLIAIFSAVGVFLAPIAVIISFHNWLPQKHLEARIETIESCMKSVGELNKLLIAFQNSNYYFNLKYCENSKNTENFNKLKIEFNAICLNLFHEVVNKTIYFNKNEMDKINNFINALNFDLIQNLDQAQLVIDTIFFKLPRDSILTKEEYEFEKNLYLINPGCTDLKPDLTKETFKEEVKAYSVEKIHKYFDEFGYYLDSLLRESYK